MTTHNDRIEAILSAPNIILVERTVDNPTVLSKGSTNNKFRCDVCLELVKLTSFSESLRNQGAAIICNQCSGLVDAIGEV